MLSKEGSSFIVFGVTWPGIEPMTFSLRADTIPLGYNLVQAARQLQSLVALNKFKILAQSLPTSLPVCFMWASLVFGNFISYLLFLV